MRKNSGVTVALLCAPYFWRVSWTWTGRHLLLGKFPKKSIPILLSFCLSLERHFSLSISYTLNYTSTCQGTYIQVHSARTSAQVYWWPCLWRFSKQFWQRKSWQIPLSYFLVRGQNCWDRNSIHNTSYWRRRMGYRGQHQLPHTVSV